MNTTSTAPNPSQLIVGRDFNMFACGRIEINAQPNLNHILIMVDDRHSLHIDNQLLDVNLTDKPEPLRLPFLDAMPGPDFSGIVTQSARVR